MGTWEKANKYAVLVAHATPQWEELTLLTLDDPITFEDLSGAPTSIDAGGYLEEALRANLQVQTRVLAAARDFDATAEDGDGTPAVSWVAEVHHRCAVLQITTFDGADEYTVNVDGTAATTSTGGSYATKADAIAAIVAKVNTTAVIQDIVEATALDLDGDGLDDSVLLEGLLEPDWALQDWSAAGGAGVVHGWIDAISASVRAYITNGGATPRPAGWTVPPGGLLDTDEYRGVSERLDIAGYDRMYLEVYDVAGHASDDATAGILTQVYRARIGPGILS